MVGIRCVHYIEQKYCTARFTTGAICKIPDQKVNQVDTSHTGGSVEGRATLLYFMVHIVDTGGGVFELRRVNSS